MANGAHKVLKTPQKTGWAIAHLAPWTPTALPKDETDPSGDSKVSDRIIGHGKALEYWRWGFFFFWLFDKVHEDKNLLVFDLAMIPFSVPTTISDLGPENAKENFLSFHTEAWI